MNSDWFPEGSEFCNTDRSRIIFGKLLFQSSEQKKTFPAVKWKTFILISLLEDYVKRPEKLK